MIYGNETKSPVRTTFLKYGTVAPTIDASSDRGKVLSEIYYGEKGQVLKSIEYEYGYSRDIPTRHALIAYRPSSEGYPAVGIYSHFQRFHFAPYQLTRKNTVDYLKLNHQTDILTEAVESYKYDNYGYITEQDIYDSREGINRTEITYTHQLPATDPLLVYSLPVTVSKKKINPQKINNVIHFKKNKYTSSNNMALLSSVETGMNSSKLRL